MTDAESTDQISPPVLVIEPGSSSIASQLGELWQYRELLYFLVWRDVKVRYKQTALGAAWAVLQPFMTMVVFSVFFGYLAKMPSDGIPYPVFAYCALLPWSLFAHALTESSNSLVNNQGLITKVYFPRLIVPIAPLFVGLVDFGIAFVVLLFLMAYYGLVPGPAIFLLPFFIFLAMATALAVGIWLSALNVQYRDVRYTIPFLTQLWLFATPVVYPSSLLPEPWRTLYGLNPMAGVVEGFRWVLLGRTGAPGLLLVVSILAVLVLLVGGLWYFNRMEQTFADVV
jgi:lipopolysaccharide transport system permease protein